MTDTPASIPGEPPPIRCPHCTIQIPADASVCPYCLRSVYRDRRERDRPEGAPTDLRQRLVPPERFPALRRYWDEHGKWLKVAAPVLLAALALWGAYGLWSGLRVNVTRDGVFLIELLAVTTMPITSKTTTAPAPKIRISNIGSIVRAFQGFSHSGQAYDR